MKLKNSLSLLVLSRLVEILGNDYNSFDIFFSNFSGITLNRICKDANVFAKINTLSEFKTFTEKLLSFFGIKGEVKIECEHVMVLLHYEKGNRKTIACILGRIISCFQSQITTLRGIRVFVE